MGRQFVLFLLMGGIAAGLNWGSRFVFSLWVPFEAAVALAFLVGLLSGFVLMRTLVFDGRGKPITPQFARYVVVNLAALAQTFLVSILLANWILPSLARFDRDKNEAIAHLVGVLVPVVTSYVGHRMATFR